MCPTTNGIGNVQCAPGYYSLGYACRVSFAVWMAPLCTHRMGLCVRSGATSCSACTAGSYCPSTTLNLILPCPTGYYSLAGSANCTMCPVGRACPSASSSASTACVSGQYSQGGQTACTSCPAGFQCPSLTDAIVQACPSGTYSTGGLAACITCPAGFQCNFAKYVCCGV